jgi:hypothetical protein
MVARLGDFERDSCLALPHRYLRLWQSNHLAQHARANALPSLRLQPSPGFLLARMARWTVTHPQLARDAGLPLVPLACRLQRGAYVCGKGKGAVGPTREQVERLGG